MIAALLPLLFFAWAASGQEIVRTADWLPPVIDVAQAGEHPELLALKVAQEELGYIEGPKRDESKYGAWFGKSRAAWCAEFVSWCVSQADARYGTALLEGVFPLCDTSGKGARYFLAQGRFISGTGRLPGNEKQWLVGGDEYLADNGYVPQPGDYIWFYYYGQKTGPDHTALVEGVSRDDNGDIRVHVIEGNNPDQVARATYALRGSRIYGFGTPVKRAYSSLRLYNEGADVQALREDMAALGYYRQERGARDTFTAKLRGAVRAFQRDVGLQADGIVGMDTHEAMEQALRNQAQTIP